MAVVFLSFFKVMLGDIPSIHCLHVGNRLAWCQILVIYYVCVTKKNTQCKASLRVLTVIYSYIWYLPAQSAKCTYSCNEQNVNKAKTCSLFPFHLFAYDVHSNVDCHCYINTEY